MFYVLILILVVLLNWIFYDRKGNTCLPTTQKTKKIFFVRKGSGLVHWHPAIAKTHLIRNFLSPFRYKIFSFDDSLRKISGN